MKYDSEILQILANKVHLVYADDAGRVRTEAGPGLTRYAVLGPVPLPVKLRGRTVYFQWYTFAPCPTNGHAEQGPVDALLHRLALGIDNPSSILTLGDFARTEAPMVRVHSCCATGDIFGSQRCECGPQLRRAQQMVADEGVGAILYLADHEGRGIGLFAKAAAYLLQDRGMDTFEANRKLGFRDDCRNFAEACFILNHLRGPEQRVRLITNNPEKRRALESGGVHVKELVPLVTALSKHNLRYIVAKRAYGHLFSQDDLDEARQEETPEAVLAVPAPRMTM